jgi:hypothetical protein
MFLGYAMIECLALQRSATSLARACETDLRFALLERGGGLLEVARSMNISSLRDEESR